MRQGIRTRIPPVTRLQDNPYADCLDLYLKINDQVVPINEDHISEAITAGRSGENQSGHGLSNPAAFSQGLAITQRGISTIAEDLPNRVTVSEVLKYFLTWATIPLAETVQALSGSEWKPSVVTVEPKEVMESGTKRKVFSDVVEEEAHQELGGMEPSLEVGARMRWRALYRVRTTVRFVGSWFSGC